MDRDPQPGDRARESGRARIMAATAEASPELKRLAGAAATGRKLEKPVCHYSLNWARDEKPDRQEMRRAAEGSLKALGMERHQALIVSHRDGQPHVHVIANRVEPESGKAAGLSRSKLRLSKWAERYEREQGKIRCPARERNNKRREAGEMVVDGRGHSGGRFRRERMSPQREPRETIPAQREGPERERVAWQRAEERMHWERIQQWRREGSRETGEAEQVGVVGALRASPAAAAAAGERLPWGVRSALPGLEGAGRQAARDRRDDPGRHGSIGALPGGAGGPGNAWSGSRLGKRIRKRCVRSRAWREKSTAAIWKGQRDGRVRRRGGTPSQCMTVIVAETGAGSSARRRRSGWSRCGEFDGEQAYEKMMQTMEEARQEKARQAEMARAVERARLEWARQETARSRERRGPERGGPERDSGPSR